VLNQRIEVAKLTDLLIANPQVFRFLKAAKISPNDLPPSECLSVFEHTDQRTGQLFLKSVKELHVSQTAQQNGGTELNAIQQLLMESAIN
jgi:hypothetical protein